MYVHFEKRLIYLAHPRTASVATAAALATVGFEKNASLDDHHSRLWDVRTPVRREDRTIWTVFTTIRNPFDTAVSWSLRRNRSGRGVEDLRFGLEDNRWVDLANGRFWWLHADDADVLLRYETLQQSLGKLLRSFGVPAVRVTAKNVTPRRNGRPYQDFYDSESRAYIESCFGAELRRFAYSF